jgi:hypothetical protein
MWRQEARSEMLLSPVATSFKHDKKGSISILGAEFLETLSGSQILKTVSARTFNFLPVIVR